MDALRADVIDRTLKTNIFTRKIYQGVFPCDKLSSFKISSFPCGMIVNFDTSSEPGSHWISLFFDRYKNVEYFDTYARPIMTNTDIYNFIHREGKNRVKYLTGNSIQSDESSVCGHYSILFLLCRSRNISFSHFANTFSDQVIVGAYDNVVKKIINELILLHKKWSIDKRFITCYCDPDQCCVTKNECCTASKQSNKTM
jgi:hypothetical protein